MPSAHKNVKKEMKDVVSEGGGRGLKGEGERGGEKREPL